MSSPAFGTFNLYPILRDRLKLPAQLSRTKTRQLEHRCPVPICTLNAARP